MNIIDVTLRDGGHAVKFDWSWHLVKDYYNLMADIPQVNFVELGYWMQESKSKNTFYNLNMTDIYKATDGRERKDVSVMIDYHYCKKDPYLYPTSEQKEVAMIRLCSRKEDIDKALKFGQSLIEYTGLNVSFNIFNISNYKMGELQDIIDKIANYSFEYVYFADTHGSLNLVKDLGRFEQCLKNLKWQGKKCGFHLHDHSGLAMVNYNELVKYDFLIDSTDTSIRGMGKGSGNLKLEHIIDTGELCLLAEFINRYNDTLKIEPSAFELLTSRYGITDNYAKKAKELNFDLGNFDSFCRSVKGTDKDSYNEELFNENNLLRS